MPCVMVRVQVGKEFPDMRQNDRVQAEGMRVSQPRGGDGQQGCKGKEGQALLGEVFYTEGIASGLRDMNMKS